MFPVISFQLQFFCYFFRQTFSNQNVLVDSVTERRVRTELSSWFSARVVCQTSTRETQITFDILFFSKRRTSFLAVVLMFSISSRRALCRDLSFLFSHWTIFPRRRFDRLFWSWSKELFCFIECFADTSFDNMSKILCVIKLHTTVDASTQWTDNGRDDDKEFVLDIQKKMLCMCSRSRRLWIKKVSTLLSDYVGVTQVTCN